MVEKRIIIYYQTLIDLSPLIEFIETRKKTSPPLLTDITLASIHFGYNEDQSPYIHLNNKQPNDTCFNPVYANLRRLKNLDNIKINLLIGGAGSAFTDLFSNYSVFYKLLKNTVEDLDFIDGFNLDIEEEANLEDIIKLVNDLTTDFPDKDIIFAPLASSLSTDEPGMGGFSYKKLDNEIGDKVAYYNAQCYGEYSEDLFNQIVSNGYKPNKIVMGMLSGQDIHGIVNEIEKILNANPTFGGVAVWEYFNAPPSAPDHPYVWCEIMSNLMYKM
jgi:hypothetical protein